MASERYSYLDTAGWWLAVGGVVATISAVPIVIGTVQRTGTVSLWSNGWFTLGIFLSFCGTICVLWSIVLHLAHRHVASHQQGPVREVHTEIEEAVRSVLDAVDRSEPRPSPSLPLGSTSNVEIQSVKKDCSDLCARLQAFAQQRKSTRPKQSPGMAMNSPEWEKWSAEYGKHNDETEETYQRDFAPEVLSLLEEMIRVQYANIGGLDSFASVRNDKDIERIARDFCKWCVGLRAQ